MVATGNIINPGTTLLHLALTLLTTTTTTTTAATTINSTSCTCLSNLIYDVIEDNNWSPITFIFDQEEGIFSSRCAIASGLYRRLWRTRRTVNSHPYDNFTLPYHTNSHKSHGFILTYTNATSTYLDQASRDGILDTTHWLLLLPPSSTPSLLAQTENLNAFINSEFLFASPNTCPTFIKVMSAYRVGPRSGALVEAAGVWEEGRGYIPPTPMNRVERRSDFQGYPMRGVGVKVFDHMSQFLGPGNVTGFVGDVVSTLKNAHNFSLSYTVLEGYAYGKIKEGSTTEWTGMVGALQSKEADLTVSELSITKERQDVVDYTQPIYIISRKLYVATQEDFAKKMLAYTTPMETALYWCILVNMAGLAGILFFIERLQRLYMPMKEKPVSMSVASWYMLSALLQQGSTTCPVSIAARGIYWLGYSVSLIVYTSYSATLVSHLTVEQPAALPFNNLRELARQDGWDAGCNNNDLFQVTATQICVDSQTDQCKVLRKVWQKVVMNSEDNLVGSYGEGLQKVLKGKYVFIAVDMHTNNYIRSMPPSAACRIKELPGRYITGGIAIGLQKHSPFRTVFDYSLQKMRESGLMDKLRRKWASPGERLCGRKNVVTASLSDVAVIFILLMGGAGFSCFLLALEHAVWYASLRWLAPQENPSAVKEFKSIYEGRRGADEAKPSFFASSFSKMYRHQY